MEVTEPLESLFYGDETKLLLNLKIYLEGILRALNTFPRHNAQRIWFSLHCKENAQ